MHLGRNIDRDLFKVSDIGYNCTPCMAKNCCRQSWDIPLPNKELSTADNKPPERN